MRDKNRIKPFLEQVEKLWLLYPDYRFGQIMYLLADELEKDMFFLEEDEWLKYVDNLIEKRMEYEKNNPISDVKLTKNDLYIIIDEMMEKSNKNQYKIK